MSNIYIKEPSTSGKVLLITSVGDIEIELWSKETPKTCRNFVQLCMEGYYDDLVFHRVIKNFIVQGGDPGGTGEGGESIYGHAFKDELHSRLRFVRRGLLAMANSGPNDNGSQFFFTMAEAPDLNNKHTIFGKITEGVSANAVVSLQREASPIAGTEFLTHQLSVHSKVAGDTVYNMLKLQEVETGANDRPLYPQKIIRTEVLSNPFDDIVPRVTKKKKEDAEAKKTKSQSKATKNFSLLSFGEEAEEDEEEVEKANKDMKGKSKSSHDLTNDPKLSAQPAVEEQETISVKRKSLENDEDDKMSDDEVEKKDEDIVKEVAKKLKTDNKGTEEKDIKNAEKMDIEETKPSSRCEELRKEAEQLKKELKESRKRKDEEIIEKKESKEVVPENDAIAEYKMERQKYKDVRKQQARKGSAREEMTLALLSKFQSKLKAAKNLGEYSDDDEQEEQEEQQKEVEEGEIDTEESTDDTGGISWMRHKLHFDDHSKKVIDANIQELDRYEIFDPRNPLTQRRREASELAMKGK